MPLYRYTDDAGRAWAVDMDGVCHIVRASIYADHILRRARKGVSTSFDRGIRLRVPTLNTDFRGVRAKVNRESPRLIRETEQQLVRSGEAAFNNLVALRRETLFCNQQFRELQARISREMVTEMDAAVSRGETTVAVLRRVREFCGNFLVAGAALLTGGAAVSVLGAGSLLQGGGEWQDSGNFGSGVLETISTFTIGYISMGLPGSLNRAAASEAVLSAEAMRAARASQTAVALIGMSISAANEFTKSMIGGNTLGVALRRAAVRMGLEGLGTLLFGMDDVAIPLLTTVFTRENAREVVRNVALNMSVDEGVERLGGPYAPPRTSARVQKFQDTAWMLDGRKVSDAEFVRAVALRPA